MDRPLAATARPGDRARDERSMRIVEYAMALAAIGVAALLAIR
jgi:hypothetical protein